MTSLTIGILITVAASVFWAGLDAVRKAIGESVPPTAAVTGMAGFQLPLMAVLLIIGAAFPLETEPWSILLAPPAELGPDYLGPFLGSVALNVAANWLFFRAVQLSPLSLTIPYLSFTPVFTLVSGTLVLGQTPTVMALFGVLAVTVGAFFLNPRDGDDAGALSPVRALWRERGSLYMLLVALLWSITPVLDKLATDATNVPTHTGLLAAGIFAAFWALRALRDRSLTLVFREVGAAPGLVAVTGLFSVVAMLLQLSAYSFVDVAYVETIKRAIGVVAAVLIGWRVFGEEDVARRLAAVAVMAVGVALVMFGVADPTRQRFPRNASMSLRAASAR